jgi:UDP-MurNAc hydroxylase
MLIEFASNASFVIRLKTGKTLLTDPWYSDGIYYGAWYNFPPIPPARRDALLKLTPDYIYISHIHPDHLDSATLAHYPRSTPILIGRFSEPGFGHLKRAIAALGFTDVRVLELWAPTELDGAQVAILPQFAACNAAESSGDSDFEMDTSLWVRDVDGASVLNVVDNALHDAAAQEILDRLGRPDVAILPYAGGSFFPQGCTAYSDAEKAAWRDRIGARRLDGFVRHAGILDAPLTVPAAGTYVLGARVAELSKFLHQPTPDEIAAAWSVAGLNPERLSQLATGDVIDTDTLAVRRVNVAGYRRYSREERWAYAGSLADRPLPHDAIRVPAAFQVPWSRLLEKAGRNMAAAASSFGLSAPYEVEIEVRRNTVEAMPEVVRHRFPVGEGGPEVARRSIRFGADDGVMLMVLLGAANWNNVEIASLMTMERTPDTQDPAIHALMNAFRL